MGAATNTPYQLISGDFGDINDRLWRAIFNDMVRHTQSIQHPYIIPQICRKMWISFVDRAVLEGKISKNDVAQFRLYRATHSPQPWQYIHPVQDVQAKEKEYKMGLTTRDTLVANSDYDGSLADLDDQRQLDYKSETSRGLPSILDEGRVFDPTSPPKT